MINVKLICEILGQLLLFEAFWMLISLGISLYYQEDDSFAFLVSIITTVGVGLLLKGKGRGAENSLSRRDAYLVVTLTWVVYSLLGTLPFLVGGYLNSLADAYLEAMSGFTSTGATVFDDVERLPHGILFWRSLIQWVGGLGIVFFTVALLPSLVGGSVKVFSAESSAPLRAKLHPRLSTTAKWIWSIYVTLTVACTVAYWLGGMSFFDSLNHAMCTTPTGGFSTRNDSFGYYDSPYLEYMCSLFTFLSGANFALLYAVVLKRRVGELAKNSEFKFYLGAVLVFTLFVAIQLFNECGYQFEEAFRKALFQVVTLMTSTGFCSDDTALWPAVTWGVLLVCMFMGGCSSSTGGGVKQVRLVMLFQIVKNELRQILHPKAVLPVRVNGVNVPIQERVTLLAFLGVYLGLLLAQTFAMVAVGIDLGNALTISFSSLGNAGPSLGTLSGMDLSWSALPDVAKWITSLSMLLGRLEIFTVLVIFTPGFWKDN